MGAVDVVDVFVVEVGVDEMVVEVLVGVVVDDVFLDGMVDVVVEAVVVDVFLVGMVDKDREEDKDCVLIEAVELPPIHPVAAVPA